MKQSEIFAKMTEHFKEYEDTIEELKQKIKDLEEADPEWIVISDLKTNQKPYKLKIGKNLIYDVTGLSDVKVKVLQFIFNYSINVRGASPDNVIHNLNKIRKENSYPLFIRKALYENLSEKVQNYYSSFDDKLYVYTHGSNEERVDELTRIILNRFLFIETIKVKYNEK